MLKDFVDTSIKWTSREYMKHIRDYEVPPRQVALWHLGQNSYILKSPGGTVIATDPYLTDYCGSKRTGIPTETSRILPVHIEPEDLDADIILITHSHDDHADPYTLERLDTCRDKARFVVPFQAVAVLEDAGIPSRNISLIHPKEELTLGDIRVEGTFCLPTDATDLNHIGFYVTFENGKTYYNSGDTAFIDLLGYMADYKIDMMAVCINGGYKNLGHFEAARVVAMVKPGMVVPAHYDVMPHNWQPPEVFRHSLRIAKAESELIIPRYFEAFLF